MLLIDAVYVHESGGKTLLEYLIRSLKKANVVFFLLADERLVSRAVYEMPTEYCIYVKPSERNRKKFYKTLDTRIKSVFCFANVPPPVLVNTANVFVFFQNTLLISSFRERNFYSTNKKILFFIKRVYLQYVNRSRYRWIVQTDTTKIKLAAALNMPVDHIKVLPFYELHRSDIVSAKRDIFLYVADGVPHKNHLILFDTWLYLLVHCQMQMELHVTIPNSFVELIERINLLVTKGVKIINHNVLQKEELQVLYNQAKFFIYPSLTESFGLPLVEASEAGCIMITADLPYIYDIIEPSFVFNPYSIADMAEAITECINNRISGTPEVKVQNRIEELINYCYS